MLYTLRDKQKSPSKLMSFENLGATADRTTLMFIVGLIFVGPRVVDFACSIELRFVRSLNDL